MCVYGVLNGVEYSTPEQIVKKTLHDQWPRKLAAFCNWLPVRYFQIWLIRWSSLLNWFDVVWCRNFFRNSTWKWILFGIGHYLNFSITIESIFWWSIAFVRSLLIVHWKWTATPKSYFYASRTNAYQKQLKHAKYELMVSIYLDQ